MCAAGAVYAPLIANFLNLQLHLFNGTPGELPAHPEPTPANLLEFQKFLQGKTIDVGFAVDPDADRIVLTDENGTLINEEVTLAVAMRYYKSQKPLKAFVRNCSSSFLTTIIAGDTKVVESKVGEVNVAMKMIQEGAELGGEGNGGVILREAHLGRDSVVAVMLVLSYLADSGKKMSQLIAEFPEMVIQKEKYAYDLGDKPKILENIEKLGQISEFECSRLDGVKLVNPAEKKWVQIRFSNTEHIFRIIAEAPNKGETGSLIKMVERVVLE